MLLIYIKSIIIWTIILFATEHLLEEKIINNKWVPKPNNYEEIKYNFSFSPRIILVASIPLLRFFIWIAFFYLSIKENPNV